MLALIFALVGIVANFRLATRVWRVNAFYGFITFLFFPAAIIFLFQHWGDEEHDIKLVFIVTLVATILFGYQIDKLAVEAEQYSDAEEVQMQSR
jgi:hypothetical protein